MQLTTKTRKDVNLKDIKEAITAGRGLEVIRPFDELEIELVDGSTVTAVFGGLVGALTGRFAIKDAMGEAPMFKGKFYGAGYINGYARRYVLEELLPRFPAEVRELFAPRSFAENIGGELVEYADTLYLPRATDIFGAGKWWNDIDPGAVQLEIFKRERDRVKEFGDKGTWPYWTSSVFAGLSSGFCFVGADGAAYDYNADYSLALAPFFDL